MRINAKKTSGKGGGGATTAPCGQDTIPYGSKPLLWKIIGAQPPPVWPKLFVKMLTNFFLFKIIFNGKQSPNMTTCNQSYVSQEALFPHFVCLENFRPDLTWPPIPSGRPYSCFEPIEMKTKYISGEKTEWVLGYHSKRILWQEN